MAQCAMSCNVIIMEHAGESGKKKSADEFGTVCVCVGNRLRVTSVDSAHVGTLCVIVCVGVAGLLGRCRCEDVS